MLNFYLWLGALDASSILASLDSKYEEQLNIFLAPVLQNPSSRFVKCWHVKTDGWSTDTFHGNCNGKGPTVTIVQVNDYIFGGYTDVSWASPGKYHFMAARVRAVYSFECRKTKTKVITLTNHKKRKQHKGPIRIRSKCM